MRGSPLKASTHLGRQECTRVCVCFWTYRLVSWIWRCVLVFICHIHTWLYWLYWESCLVATHLLNQALIDWIYLCIILCQLFQSILKELILFNSSNQNDPHLSFQKPLSTRLKDSIVNFVSPKKGRRAPIRDANSISHTLLFRSGSADWTSSPKTLDRQCRSKSEKILNRKSIFGSRSDIADSDDLPSTSTTANSEYSKFREMHRYHLT